MGMEIDREELVDIDVDLGDFDGEDFDAEDFDDEDFDAEDFDDEDFDAEDFDNEDFEGFDDEDFEGFNDGDIGVEESDKNIGNSEEQEDTNDMGIFSIDRDLADEVIDPNDSALDVGDDSVVKDDNIFNDSGDIVVMDTNGRAFKFEYIDIKNIVVSERIRKNINVVALTQSIKVTGLLKPIVVAETATEGTYVLIDGLKRIVASAKCGITKVPAIINTKIKTTELTIVEALYNHYTQYTITEIVDYIHFLEEVKGINDQSTIEHLVQLDPGDYPKLKDILNDDDDDITEKMFTGEYTIEQAFNKLKQKRKKQSKEDKEIEKADKVFGEGEVDESLVALEGVGDVGDGIELDDNDIAELGISPNMEDMGDKSVGELLEEGSKIDGFEPNEQKVGERTFIDPALRKAVMARDKDTCQACFEGGESYIMTNDYHHILPVFLGGKDTKDNGVCICCKCHRMIHLYARGELYLPELETMSQKDQEKFKKILGYGNYIRKAMEKKGMKLKNYKKQDNMNKVGRAMPGQLNQIG